MIKALRLYRVPALCPVLLIFVGMPPAFSHAAPEAVSAELTGEIEQDRMNAQLLLQRAESYRHSKDWGLALADYAAAEAMGMDEDISFYRARMYLDAGQANAAIAESERFLEHHPGNPPALVTLAYAEQLAGDTIAAIAALEKALLDLALPTADYYLDLSTWYESEADTAAALRTLDAGSARLSGATALQIRALELAEASGDYAGALRRLDELPEMLAVQPVWLLRKGDLLANLGRTAESVDAYKLAQSSLDAMSEVRRNRQVNQTIQESLNQRLDSTEQP